MEEQSSERGKEGVQWSGRGRVVARKESGKPGGTESKRAKDRDRQREICLSCQQNAGEDS